MADRPTGPRIGYMDGHVDQLLMMTEDGLILATSLENVANALEKCWFTRRAVKALRVEAAAVRNHATMQWVRHKGKP